MNNTRYRTAAVSMNHNVSKKHELCQFYTDFVRKVFLTYLTSGVLARVSSLI